MADIDYHKDSDLPLTDDEKELGTEAAHISSLFEQLQGSMGKEIGKQCQYKAHTARQNGGGVAGSALEHLTDSGIIGPSAHEFLKDIAGIVGSKL